MPSRTALVFSNRGDPGILSVLGRFGRGFVKGILGIAGGGTRTARVFRTPPINPPVGQIPGLATPLIGAGTILARGAAGVAGRVARAGAAGPLVRAGAKILAGGALFELGGVIFDAITGERVSKKPRRINVLNPRALSRATRRLSGFNRRVKTVEKVLRRLAPPARRRVVHHLDDHHHDHHH